jgi:hypothetical protein
MLIECWLGNKMTNYLLKNLISATVIILTVGVSGAWAEEFKSKLPKCKGADASKWDKCLGLQENSEFSFYGEYKKGLRNGYGEMTVNHKDYSKQIYKGYWVDNKMNGRGVFSAPSGEYKGNFENNFMSGYGLYTYSNGDRYKGEFKNDDFDGIGTYHYSNGDKYFGKYKNNKKNGEGIFLFANGKKLEGLFENGNFIKEEKIQLTGINHFLNANDSEMIELSELKKCEDVEIIKWNNCAGEIKLSNGDQYSGEFKDGLPNGKGAYFYLDGRRYVGYFKNGKKNGRGMQSSNNGDLYDGNFSNDLMHGQGLYMHRNGDYYSGEQRNNNKNGIGSYVWVDGSKYFGEWKDNKFNGKGIYTKIGGDTLEGIWNNGKFIKEEKVKLSNSNKFKFTKNEILEIQNQRLTEERRKIEEEKYTKEQAQNNQGINLQVTNTQPDANGVVNISIKTNIDTASLKINDEELGGKQDGNYIIRKVARAGQETKFTIVAVDINGNTDSKTITVTRQITASNQINTQS